MGLGLIGAMGGLADAGSNIGNQMFADASKRELQADHYKFLEQQRQMTEKAATAREIAKEDRIEAREKTKRDAFTGEMDRVSAGKNQPTIDTLASARKGYETNPDMTEENRQTVLSGLDAEQERVKSLRPELSAKEIANAGLKTGIISGEKYTGLLGTAATTQDKLMNAVLLKQLGNEGSMDRTVVREDRKDGRQERGQEWKGGEKDKDRAHQSGETDKKIAAYGNRAGQTSDKEWSKTSSDYRKYFDIENQGSKMFDAEGKALFDSILSRERTGGGAPAETADSAITVIQRLRQKATVDGVFDQGEYSKYLTKYKSLLKDKR